MSDAIERLEAIEEIRRLKARYWRFVDTKQWERFGELWAPDATFTDHSAAFHCDGAQEVRDKIAAALPDDVVTVHHGHQSEIEIDEPRARPRDLGDGGLPDFPVRARLIRRAPRRPRRCADTAITSRATSSSTVNGSFRSPSSSGLRLEVSGETRTEYPTWSEAPQAVGAGA